MKAPRSSREPVGPLRTRSGPFRLPGRIEARRGAAPKRRSAPVTRRHPVYGEVPIVPGPGASGGTGRLWLYDPDYRPDLPSGAVRGDPRRQLFCCDVPRYFYVDLDRTCRDCGAPFVFSAREQKHWYETLGFRLDASAVRCLPCRRAFRRDKGIGRALSDASRAPSSRRRSTRPPPSPTPGPPSPTPSASATPRSTARSPRSGRFAAPRRPSWRRSTWRGAAPRPPDGREAPRRATRSFWRRRLRKGTPHSSGKPARDSRSSPRTTPEDARPPLDSRPGGAAR
ncbi:MAG: zinc-ribbon domain-containing protein [Holophagales bacterium]|nr:zinc-ribbon domain-containing protein [Holophagales bacterium]